MAASYENVGLRAIAATAGVSLGMITRYFGTKDRLFLEVMTHAGFTKVIGGEVATLPERMARNYLEDIGVHSPQDLLVALLRSIQNETAAHMLREMLQGYARPLAPRMEGGFREERVEMALAVLIGVSIVRDVLHTEPLASLGDDDLLELLGPMLRAALLPTSGPKTAKSN